MLAHEKDEIIERHQAKLPVNIVGMARGMGATVYRARGWPDYASGKIEVDEERGGHDNLVIYVNAKHSLNRRRFTIAHEVAHIILHRDLIGDGITTDGLYRSGLGTAAERAANRLAGNLLMPWQWIRELTEDEGITSVSTLASRFQVSRDAMVIQLDYHWMLDWDHPPSGG